MTLSRLDKAPFPYFGTIEVRADGSVWRIVARGKPIVPRRVDMPDGSKGYRNVVLPDPVTGRWRTHKAHRLVWAWHHGPIPEGLQVNHRNLVKDDNRIDNLELVTSSANILHSYANGRPRPFSYARTWRGRTRLTEEQKTEIRTLRHQGMALSDIAVRFGISVSHTHRTAGRKEVGE